MGTGRTELVIWLTPKCNLKCAYCFQTCSPATFVDPQTGRRTDERATEELIEAAADFVQRNRIDHVEFFGGEPLYYRRLFERAVDLLRTRCPDVSLGLVTNGTLINERIMSLIEQHTIAVLLSLDGGRDGHDRLRGGYDRIARWFDRLQTANVSVACQAGVIPGLHDNIREIWAAGFSSVFVNVIENHGWYTDADVERFETEYELALLAMLRGEGVLNCAKRIHAALKGRAFSRECGIIRKGLACDWDGNLFPCHRAVELGPDYAIGTLRGGLDTTAEKAMRARIEKEAFQSTAGGDHDEVSFCAVSMIQNYGRLNGVPNEAFCRMIEVKHKLVAKHHYAMEALELAAADRASEAAARRLQA